MEKENAYVAPVVDVIEVEVEKGFAVSGSNDTTYGAETPGWSSSN